MAHIVQEKSDTDVLVGSQIDSNSQDKEKPGLYSQGYIHTIIFFLDLTT